MTEARDEVIRARKALEVSVKEVVEAEEYRESDH